MTKKKVTHQPQVPRDENPQEKSEAETHPHPSMEDPKEKLQNLKSLNSLLLKETIERRQQVESLVQAKEALETELSRFGKEKAELETELSQHGEEKVSLEIEKGIFCVFVETLLGEMGIGVDGLLREKRERENEIGFLKSEVSELMGKSESERERFSTVCKERDLLRSDVDNWIREANILKERVVEMEKKEEKTEEELGKLKVQYGSIVKLKDAREKEIEELRGLRDSAEKNLSELLKKIEEMKVEIEEIDREKNAIEIEKNGQKLKIIELEQEVGNLNDTVSSLQKEEGILRGKLLELETSYGEAMEKEKAMAIEIDALMEEKRENEKIIERLIDEKNSIEKFMKMVESELKDKDELVEKLLREKKDFEEVKVSKESEIAELCEEVGKFRDVASALQESIKNQEDKTRQLELEVSHYRDAFERVKLERDNAQKVLDEERKNSMNFRSKVGEMEMKIEENAKEFAKMKCKHENLAKEKKEMEQQLEMLKEDKDILRRNLLEAQHQLDDLKAKMESAAINSEKALSMLKNTVALVCQSINGKEELIPSEKKLDDEIEPYVMELEMIKSAFRNKETVVEEMKQQVELLKNTVTMVNKKKSFWTLVSSATTVFAAVSLAYVSRLR